MTQNVYAACDRAIKAMDRENVEAFGRLKLAKWDELHIIRTVVAVYTQSAKRARKRYRNVAYEAFLIAWEMCGLDRKNGEKQASSAITWEWVDRILTETDFVTLYRFDTETERKAYRLAEALEVAENRNAEIDKALRFWSRQLGQYAINFTDYAMIQAFQDAGVERVRWVTQKDDRVCDECASYDEQVFDIDDVPDKHWNCRCYLVPVRN